MELAQDGARLTSPNERNLSVPRRLLVSLLAAAALLAALPAAAPAAVTIGSTLAGTGTNGPGGCNSICTGTNFNLPAANTAAGGLVSPINGVVVRWRVKTASTGNNPITFRVLRPGGGTTFTGAGSSTTEALSAATVDATGIAQFGTRLPIRADDSVGLNPGNSALVWATNAGATVVHWSVTNGFAAGLGDGQTAAGMTTNQELMVQAVVEVDTDGDGFGNETQDGCPGDGARQTPPCATGDPNPGGNPPPPPVTAPRIGPVRVTPARFRIDTTGRVRFRLSEAARYRLTFDQILPGRRRGARCVRQTRLVRTGTRCSAFVRRGFRSGAGAAGANAVAFRGRIGRRALPAGRYRVTVGATDSDGNTATTRSARFTLLRRS